MSNERDSDGSYVDKIRRSNREYVSGLLEELDRGRKLVATLEQEIVYFKEEKLRLQGLVLDLREEIDRRNAEQVRLQRELLGVEKQNSRYSEEYLVVEQQNANLANLYVASYRLHGTLNRAEVIDAIKEIVINMIGSEELAIFETNDGYLELIGAFGVDEEKFAKIAIGEGPIGRVAAEGKLFARGGKSEFSDGFGSDLGLTACIPLEIDGAVTGAIAVFRLLEQKSGLEELDFELFDLLKTHASTALYSTGLHAKSLSGAIKAAG